MKKGGIIYINFPISLLKEAFSNIRETVDLIFDYAVYKHSRTLEHGDDLARMKAAAKFFNIKFGNIENALSSAKELQTNPIYDLRTPNASININVLWDFYKNKKTESDIACFCAFCAIKSILGSKEYVKTNKAMIISRMFGDSKVTQKSDKQYPTEFKSLTDAANYVNNKYGHYTNSGALGQAYKAGKLKAEKIDKNNTASYIVKRKDLDEWYLNVYESMISFNDENFNLKNKYSKRYHIDTVLTELQLNWNLKLYSDHSRGFYLSFSKSLEDLAVINELAKRSRKENDLTKQKQQAKEAALRKLGL